jgi:hypothetical protein
MKQRERQRDNRIRKEYRQIQRKTQVKLKKQGTTKHRSIEIERAREKAIETVT